MTDGYSVPVGGTYSPDDGQHAGHCVRVVAADMPPNDSKRWVECECGEAWAFTSWEAEQAAKGEGY